MRRYDEQPEPFKPLRCAECGQPVSRPRIGLRIVAAFCAICSRHEITPNSRVAIRQK
jgi:hypothetical protein